MNQLKLVAFFILISASSCTKHKGDIIEHVPAASVSFSSPTANTIYQVGDSVLIAAKAISTATIHGCDIFIRKTGDTTNCFNLKIHDHNDTVLISQKWKANTRGNMEAEIILYLDHEGNTLSKKSVFTIR